MSSTKLSTQPYKGARDFYPEDMRVQKYMFGVLRSAVERFGYQEYDAPILEPLEIYLAKTGEEIVNEQVYNFVDRGGRRVAIRPEMTPTVSRMVAARRQELSYPLRWYSIPNVWRYERPQRGRLREHWQLNVDLFGIDGWQGDFETLQIADAILKSFGAKPEMYVIKLNHRKLMNELLRGYLGLSKAQAHDISKLIDKKHKMSDGSFETKAKSVLTASQVKSQTLNKLIQALQVKSIDELPESIRSNVFANDLNDLLDQAKKNSITNIEFDITLMRGFDYYTDIVFEVFDTDPENNRSMFGGGRYNGLVEAFGVDAIPTVGFGIGDVTLRNFLESHKLLPSLQPETEVYVILLGNVSRRSQKVLAELRDMGLNIAVDAADKKVDKKIKSALKQGYRYALFIGSEELAEQQYRLKDLTSGEEYSLSAQRIVAAVKDYRA